VRALGFLAIGAFIVWMIFDKARERAESSAEMRSRMLVTSVVGLVIGCVIALWLPHRVSINTESPAAIVILLLFWIVGGSLALANATALVAAFWARLEAS
jgi:uncharacterized membrane protein